MGASDQEQQVRSDPEKDLESQLRAKLAQDAEECREYGEEPPTKAAVATCLRLARLLLPRATMMQGLRLGAFAEDPGGVSLVVQSSLTGRRINCRIFSDGEVSLISKTDKYVEIVEAPGGQFGDAAWQECLGWVVGDA